jgi:hypothetical protein
MSAPGARRPFAAASGFHPISGQQGQPRHGLVAQMPLTRLSCIGFALASDARAPRVLLDV